METFPACAGFVVEPVSHPDSYLVNAPWAEPALCLQSVEPRPCLTGPGRVLSLYAVSCCFWQEQMSARLESWVYFRLELALCAWLMPLHFYRIKFNHKKSFLSSKSQVRMIELKRAFQPIETRNWCALCPEATGPLTSWLCKVHFHLSHFSIQSSSPMTKPFSFVLRKWPRP